MIVWKCHSRVRVLPSVPGVVDELDECWIRVVICFEGRIRDKRETIVRVYVAERTPLQITAGRRMDGSI